MRAAPRRGLCAPALLILLPFVVSLGAPARRQLRDGRGDHDTDDQGDDQNSGSGSGSGSASSSPTPAPAAARHPCEDGSHGCDKSKGGECFALKSTSAAWRCACKTGYVCTFGCAGEHSNHTCKRAAPSPPPTHEPTGAICVATARYLRKQEQSAADLNATCREFASLAPCRAAAKAVLTEKELGRLLHGCLPSTDAATRSPTPSPSPTPRKSPTGSPTPTSANSTSAAPTLSPTESPAASPKITPSPSTAPTSSSTMVSHRYMLIVWFPGNVSSVPTADMLALKSQLARRVARDSRVLLSDITAINATVYVEAQTAGSFALQVHYAPRVPYAERQRATNSLLAQRLRANMPGSCQQCTRVSEFAMLSADGWRHSQLAVHLAQRRPTRSPTTPTQAPTPSPVSRRADYVLLVWFPGKVAAMSAADASALKSQLARRLASDSRILTSDIALINVTADAKEMMHSIVAQVRYVSSVPRAERERALKCLLLRPLRVSMPGGGGDRVSAFAMLSADGWRQSQLPDKVWRHYKSVKTYAPTPPATRSPTTAIPTAGRNATRAGASARGTGLGGEDEPGFRQFFAAFTAVLAVMHGGCQVARRDPHAYGTTAARDARHAQLFPTDRFAQFHESAVEFEFDVDNDH